MMSVLFAILALVATVQCAHYDGGLVNTGRSDQYRDEDSYGHYEFGYNEDHATGGTFRKEKGGPGYQVGSYGLRDADGRMRIVHYVADAHGFRATITSNEPGVDTSQSPASTSMSYVPPIAVSHSTIAPVTVAHNSYAGPSYPVHYSPVITKPVYKPIIGNKYSMPSNTAYLSPHFSNPILKSAYIPTLTPQPYSSMLTHGNFGKRVGFYGANPYQGYHY